MIQAEGYYQMTAYVIWFCIHVQAAGRTCELTHPNALTNDATPKELNNTKVDWFLTHPIFMLTEF